MKGDGQGLVGGDDGFMELVFAVVARFKDHFTQVLDDVGLSAPQAHALFNLGEPISQRELAHRLGYDASNVTGIVDRLEERGMVERCVDPADRRVKNLVLTLEGRAALDQLWARVTAGNPFAAALTQAECATMRSLLAKVAGDSAFPGFPLGASWHRKGAGI
jgi:DNA-binding MarR family transcriptional regulator